MRLRSLAVLTVFSTTLLVPGQVFGQSGGAAAGTVDEGIFVITRNGAVVGRESFRIVRSPSASGDVYRATAQLAVGDQRIVPSLSADANGAPLSYDVAVQDGPEAVRLQGRARPGRFSAMLRTRNGESTKEYVVPPSAVVLDDDISHQLFFVTLGNRRSGSLTIIDPRSNAQTIATLESHGASTVEIGGKSVPAMHFALEGPGVSRREFWVDSAGRVLKVAAPARGLVAQRDELPR